ncbi:MAG: leucyl aminopeptidase [Bacteroidales bacterium]|jgi:leucyl aminopeptidase
MLLFNCDQLIPTHNRILVFSNAGEVRAQEWPSAEKEYINFCLESNQRLILLNRFSQCDVVVIPDPAKTGDYLLEEWRVCGFDIHETACRNKWQEMIIVDHTGHAAWIEAMAEGIALSNYQFLKYYSNPAEKKHSFQQLGIYQGDSAMIRKINSLIYAVSAARDLVNEPVSYLNAPQLGDDLEEISRSTGLGIEILDKTQIESLRMGGLLAVNKGSIDPPRFIIMSWEPENPVNEAPLVLVGKGITFDTGGLSIKPTSGSMDEMKCDMAGAAAVAGTMITISKLNLPVRIIGLIPATDNRPDGNAYAPGDVIRMHDNTTVEVLNCDAEGRLILADALSYARKYKPGLVIDLATLTGSAQVALGSHASAVMGTAPHDTFEQLIQSGFTVHERLVRFPIWNDYAKLIESEIADVKNVGGRNAGAITAGKFLERFTDYPWIHIDIAGTAFLTARESYRGIGGTGTGIRLLLEFITKYYQL